MLSFVFRYSNSKWKFHTKMGTIKDRNDIELVEEDIKKRCKEYMEELYKKDLKELDNHDGVVSHPEPAFGSVKLCGP